MLTNGFLMNVNAVFRVILFISILFYGNSTVSAQNEPDGPRTEKKFFHNPLDLETAQKIAIEGNPGLAAAADRVRQASEQVAQARASYWPTLDLNGAASRQWRSDTAREALGNPDDPEDLFGSDLEAVYVLFDGFARQFRNLSADYGKQASREAERNARRLLLSSVASAFHSAQLALEDVAIAEANESFNRRQAEDAKARERAGTGSLSDVLNFEVQINTARTEVLRSKRVYASAMIGLAALMGADGARLPEGTTLTPLEDETEKDLTLPEPEEMVLKAYTLRPDLAQSEMRLNQADAGIGEARSGYYPTLSLSGSVDGSRLDDPAFGGDDIGGSLMMRFNFNLFEGGLTQARIREAAARKSEIINDLQDLQNAAASDVRKALELLHSVRDQLYLQRKSVEMVEKNRNLVEKEYQAGQASLVRLNEAQRDLTQAQSRLALARVSLRQAWQDLKTATGEILTPFEDGGLK